MDSNGDMNSKNGGRIRKPNFLYNIRDYDLGYSDSHSDNVASVGPVGGGETEEVSLQVQRRRGRPARRERGQQACHVRGQQVRQGQHQVDRQEPSGGQSGAEVGRVGVREKDVLAKVATMFTDSVQLVVPDGEQLVVPDIEQLVVPDGEQLAISEGEQLDVSGGEQLEAPGSEQSEVPSGEQLQAPSGEQEGPGVESRGHLACPVVNSNETDDFLTRIHADVMAAIICWSCHPPY